MKNKNLEFIIAIVLIVVIVGIVAIVSNNKIIKGNIIKDNIAGQGIGLKSNELTSNKISKELIENTELRDNNRNNHLLTKRVYLVSDANWEDVYQLIPNAKISNPTKIILSNSSLNNNLRNNPQDDYLDCPILIYHEEYFGFDVDSIVHFMNQYQTEEVVLINSGDFTDNVADVITDNVATLDNVIIIQPEDVIDYVYSTIINKVVYSSHLSRYAMLASSYAALIQVPLVINNSYFDNSAYLEGKEVVLIGDVDCPENSICNDDETYNSIQEIQQAYIDESQTNKIILVNPNDRYDNFEIHESQGVEDLSTDLGNGTIHNLYYKTSLSAPILARAKKEVILFYDSILPFNIISCSNPPQPQFEQEFFNLRDNMINQIEELNFHYQTVEYLTIIAAPNAIIDSKDYQNQYNCDNSDYNVRKWGTDKRILINLFSNIKTGRIYSLTSSDVSAYINRAIYYEELFKNIYGDNALTFQTINALIDNNGDNSMSTQDFSYLVYSTILNWIAYEKNYDVERAMFDYENYEFPQILTSVFMNFFVGAYLAPNGILNLIGQYLPNYNYPTGQQLGDDFSQEYEESHYIPPFSNFDYDSLSNKQIIVTISHGVTIGFNPFLTSDQLPDLNLGYFISPSCMTNFFWSRIRPSTGLPNPRHNNFGANVLRKGGIAAQGLVTQGTGPIMFSQTLLMIELFNNPGMSLGEMNNLLVDFNIMTDNDWNSGYQYALLGDPTVILKTS